MIVRELLDKLNIKEEDVIQIGDNSYSRNELYSLPKNELIFDKEVSEIYINVYDGWQHDDTLLILNVKVDLFVFILMYVLMCLHGKIEFVVS